MNTLSLSAISSTLALSELIRRGVPVEWHEGVALVRAVIERLTALPSQPTVIPELHHIELGPSGRVEVLGGNTADEPVRRLGQLLQATLVQSEPPVQLRLVISQATAPTPHYGSVREFDEILGFYERPGRDTLLQQLYERAAAAPSVSASQSTPVPTIDSVAPLPSREHRRPVRPPKSPEQKRRARRLVAVAVVLLALGGAAVQYMRVSGPAQSNAEVAAFAVKASEAVGEAVLSGLSAVTEQAGLGRLTTDQPAAAAPTTPPVPVDGTTGKLVADRQTGSTPPTVPTTPMLVFDLDVTPKVSVQSSEPAEASSSGDTESAPAVADRSSVVDLYTPEHQGIVPPVGVRPQLPRELPRNVRLEDLARVELIVAADGTVETVKLVSSPRTVHDSMWVSAIKAWQFQPALKDGQAVRYLKTVWLAPQ